MIPIAAAFFSIRAYELILPVFSFESISEVLPLLDLPVSDMVRQESVVLSLIL